MIGSKDTTRRHTVSLTRDGIGSKDMPTSTPYQPARTLGTPQLADAQTLNGHPYADVTTADAVVLQSAKDYADTGDAATLAAAEAYADEHGGGGSIAGAFVWMGY